MASVEEKKYFKDHRYRVRSKRTKRIKLIYISVFLLLLGLSLYLLFNRSAFVAEVISSIITLPDVSPSGLAAVLLRNYGADLLWSVSFTFTIQAILWLKRDNLLFLQVCCLLGVVYELLQFIGIANGTPDIVDLIVYIVGSAFGIIIIIGGEFYEEK